MKSYFCGIYHAIRIQGFPPKMPWSSPLMGEKQWTQIKYLSNWKTEKNHEAHNKTIYKHERDHVWGDHS